MRGPIAALIALLATALPALPQAQAVEVDLQLVLAVDVSRSMTPRELEIQRRGYVEALLSDEVIDAIRSGPLGRIGVSYFEWAGWRSHQLVAGWTLIETAEDAATLAAQIAIHETPALNRTSISGALLHGRDLLAQSPFVSNRRVIDISGDGPNNHGAPVLDGRDTVLAEGIVINGLPLMTQEGIGGRWHLDDLDLYYLNCVTGGPGSFVLPVYEWSQFAAAVRRKLVLEIAGAVAAPVIRAQFAQEGAEGYDCLIGERMIGRERNLWRLP